MPQTIGLVNNRNLFLRALEAEKLKDQGVGSSVSAEDQLPGLETSVFALCPPVAEGMRGLPEVPFVRAQIPFTRAPPS